MTIPDKIKSLHQQLPAGVKLVAVSKTQPVDDILAAYDAGQRLFGENKVQEIAEKKALLPSDIQWHMIGHLQTNKVKYIAPFVSLIHSVDSLRLLAEINKEALKNNRVIDCLLEFHIAAEESKFGLTHEKARELLSSDNYNSMKNIRICGVMGMASFVDDEAFVRAEFRLLANIFQQLKSHFFAGKEYFSEISMGMSSDYMIAVEEGSTMVRVGTAIFGERNYL
ncbi:MAG TPA: YggS family pyridoxal phosphate-dependent enzyme [Bacteroidales bacterium]|jgi:pyridoxal phosphate enzyme (YggS family)|nr:YggS family pyridoxal phosphate-dependent enzyme [Bacteroidales bacterium]HNZ43800.1 YggS family pyridoxal phosphate-dependent enzyme [Bacteroidales bacterium]HPB26551.1 YggS family pyridoxal phosphate-dependent enzyme [Bacteroidales bacterium]HPI29662.1 YggS family pyridoxal phosphate-dependent enzyme [Bacteroidales bacterium]HQN17380.1 YggS family pyridoxal phosphate-dependent enzyme [Bacteroidales bacterium]